MTDEIPLTDRMNATSPVTMPLTMLLKRLGAARAKLPPEERANLPAIRRPAPVAAPELPRPRPEQIIAMARRLEIIFPLPNLSPKERSERYQLFCADLAPVPYQHLLRAEEKYRKSDAKFFPTPGQLLALC
jgi:hypothetical protein